MKAAMRDDRGARMGMAWLAAPPFKMGGYGRHIVEFTAEDAEQLAKHFSNVGDDIFVITTPSQVDRGALMSRYSRSSKSMRRVFLDEFLNNPNRGKQFYKRVLMEYGDDSVAELGTAQLAVEGLSNVATQTIEDRRIGLSFLEKSSRYVSWAAKSDGHYRYYQGSDILESRHEKLYKEACDFSFDTYAESLTPALDYLKDARRIDDFSFVDSNDGVAKPFSKLTLDADIKAAERAYQNAAKSMALDLLRGLLPASTLTNLAVTGNGRAFEYLINILNSSGLREEQNLGKRFAAELESTMGPFIRRASEKYGKRLEEYLAKIGKLAKPTQSLTESDHGVQLVSHDPPADALNIVVAGLLYENSNGTFAELLDVARNMGQSQKCKIVHAFADARKNRRHRPPRAFEMVSYTFDMTNNFGMFRDMHRHRVLTLQRQALNVGHGYEMPSILDDMSLSSGFKECMRRSAEVYERLARDDAQLAQYAVNFAYRYRYVIRVNLRELCHLVELRTLPQGHQDYRNAAYQMYKEVCRVNPEISSIIKFADPNSYFMGRLDSEMRTAVKIMAGDAAEKTDRHSK